MDGRTRVALCCDLGRGSGIHHVVRALALAEELVSRGVGVTLVCDTEASPWAQAQINARALRSAAPPASADGYVPLLEHLAADAAVFDSHTLPAAVYRAVRGSGRPTVAIIDGEPDGAEADILVDPNVGADEGLPRAPRGSTLLAGLDYALMRNDVLANRPIVPPRHEPSAARDVPVVMVLCDDDHGSTRMALALARTLVATGRPFNAAFVSASAGTRQGLGAVRTAPRQRVEVMQPSHRLFEHVARADVVLSPAGPVAVELLCTGAATGLVWADDDQVDSYRGLMMRRAVIGLGSLGGLEADPRSGVEKATRLLADARERARLAETGWRLVDGLGRARVADALADLMG